MFALLKKILGFKKSKKNIGYDLYRLARMNKRLTIAKRR